MTQPRYYRRPRPFKPRVDICNHCREQGLRERELDRPARWFTFSFEDPALGYVGTANVRANGPRTAMDRIKELGICPLTGQGGRISGCPVPSDIEIPERFADRLLDQHEAEELVEWVSSEMGR